MFSKYIKMNCDYWSQAVYDNPNPESYVFRIYGRVIKHQFGMSGSNGETLLDFGCGSGGNVKFFYEKGFDVYGVDQSVIDIDRCKARISEKASQFRVVDPICRENDDWFGGKKFSIITSFQTLYYLSDTDLQLRLRSLDRMLLPGGLFIATMMHSSSWYYQMSVPDEDGLRFVRFRRAQDEGRPNLVLNDHYINFTETDEELRWKFRIFQPVHSKGYYDGVYRDDQGSERHLVFIGQKIS